MRYKAPGLGTKKKREEERTMQRRTRSRDWTVSILACGGLLAGAMALGTASCSSSSSPATAPIGDDASTTPDSGTFPDTGSSVPDTGSSVTPDSGSPSTTRDAGDAGTTSDGGPMAVTIVFKAKVGTQDFACNTTYTGVGATGISVQPADFRFYVQSVRLVDATGKDVPVTLDTRSPWQTPDVALLDFENGTGACATDGNPEMNATVTGTVPPGTYTGIVFENGVPDALNHSDPLTVPPPLQPAPMTWGWLYGYKFIKAELAATGAPTGDAAPGYGLLHLGSVGCEMDGDGGDAGISCSIPDRNEVRLTGYQLGSSIIVADIASIFQGTDLSQDNQCHSGGPACPPMFAAAGVDLTTGQSLATQAIYRLE